MFYFYTHVVECRIRILNFLIFFEFSIFQFFQVLTLCFRFFQKVFTQRRNRKSKIRSTRFFCWSVAFERYIHIGISLAAKVSCKSKIYRNSMLFSPKKSILFLCRKNNASWKNELQKVSDRIFREITSFHLIYTCLGLGLTVISLQIDFLQNQRVRIQVAKTFSVNVEVLVFCLDFGCT